MIFQRTGYDTRSLVSNAALGFFDGIDSVLWCYAFATIIFSNALAAFLPLGLAIMLGGWAFLSISVALTSRAPVHMIALDEQAVVIIGSISVVMVAEFGSAASSLRGLATILAIMSLVSLLVALCLFIASRPGISRLLELLPYPVICGFMAGIGWLLLDAGVTLALDVPISAELLRRLYLDDNLFKLMTCIGGGVFLFVFTASIEKPWSLPAASIIIILVFIIFALVNGHDIEGLRAQGWIFDIGFPDGGVTGLLGQLSLSHIDTGFIVSVAPQLVTIVFLTMLAASMNLSAMMAINLKSRIRAGAEMKTLGRGNLLCAAICCPPGFTDAPASILYQGFGATTRWMPLTSSLVCLLVALGGNWLVSYTPKVLIGATIFLFAFQLFYDWMYANVRSFRAPDYAIVCIILATVIGFGFMHGIVVGILLTVLVFVLRYSAIPVIQEQYSLVDHRSSVERSVAADKILEQHGGEALGYVLRGYLFFGTANTIRDAIRDSIESGSYGAILLDLRRVTGIDVSAMNAFAQVMQICNLHGIRLLYACNDEDTRDKLVALGAVSLVDDQPQVFLQTDFAIEQMEQALLAKYENHSKAVSVRQQLMDILENEEKVQALLDVMIRVECQAGENLFHQGDPDTGFYVLESGSMSATISTGKGPSQRLKKFSAGSVIGELSSYTIEGTRTASVVADEPAVLYYLNPDTLDSMEIVHELVARTMGLRMDYMNRRLMWELA